MNFEVGQSITPRRKLTRGQEDQALIAFSYRWTGSEWTNYKGMKYAAWSIWTLFDRMEQTAYKGKLDLLYLGKDYWDFDHKKRQIIDGSKDIIVDVPQNPTWDQIAVACDSAIAQSTDKHHIFVEDIVITEHNGKKYIKMILGS